MKIKEYRTQFIQELAPIYDVGEAENFFYLILEEKHKLKRIDLALQPDLVFIKNNENLTSYNTASGMSCCNIKNLLIFGGKIFVTIPQAV